MQVDDLLTMGSRKLRDLSKRKTDLARIYTDTIAKLAEITQEWEKKPGHMGSISHWRLCL